MKKENILKYASLNALGTFAYVILITIFFYFARLGFFGDGNPIIIPMAMLMLFVFSAALTGSLVLGKPIMWYLDGKKREALKLFAYTLVALFILTVIAFIILIILSA